MSDQESGDGGKGRGYVEEEELASRTLHIQSKRFYLDVKENRRGRFLKIAEVGAGGRKSRLLLAMSTAAEFRDHLTDFSDHYASLGPPNPDNPAENGKLKSATMVKENRHYYLDMKENQRGRFLRVRHLHDVYYLFKILDRLQLAQVSMTMTTSMQRQVIVIPAQGLIEVRDTLTDLLKEFGTDDNDGLDGLPEAQSLRVENKMFYFDIGQNRRGVFMRLSEVRPNYRTAITIPERFWGRFRDILSDYIDQTSEPNTSAKSTSSKPAVAASDKADVAENKVVADKEVASGGDSEAAPSAAN